MIDQATGVLSSLSPLWGLIALPIGGALAVRAVPDVIARAVALIVASLELVAAVAVVAAFRPESDGPQFVSRLDWGPASAWVGVDGVNVLFLPLTALLAWLAIWRAGADPDPPAARLQGLLLWEAAVVGAFTALNVAQFWLCGLAELMLLTRLVHSTGLPEGRPAVARWLGVRVLGEVLFLAALVALGALARTRGVAADVELLATLGREGGSSLVAMLLFYALAIRLALFPFHAWLPAMAAVGWLPAGILLMVSVKVGAYGLLRFVVPVLPPDVELWRGVVVVVGLAGMVYGALMALLQTDLRRLLAFAVISENGALLVGLASLDAAGLQGGLLLTLNLCLATAGLFFATDALAARTGTTRIAQMGGLFDRLPLLGLTFLAATLSTLAMPGTPGFEAAHLALEGMLAAFHWSTAYAAAAGNVLVASVLLWTYQRVFFARATEGAPEPDDLRGAERWVAGGLCAIIFGVGLYANPWIETVSRSLDAVAAAARPGDR